MQKFPDTFRVISQKRFWPHIDKTGGFFVAKIEKYARIETRERTRPEVANQDIHLLGKSTLDDRVRKNISFYEHLGKVLATYSHPKIDELRKQYYFMRL